MPAAWGASLSHAKRDREIGSTPSVRESKCHLIPPTAQQCLHKLPCGVHPRRARLGKLSRTPCPPTYLVEELIQHCDDPRRIGLDVQPLGRLVQVHEHRVHERVPLQAAAVSHCEELFLHLRKSLRSGGIRSRTAGGWGWFPLDRLYIRLFSFFFFGFRIEWLDRCF